MAQGASVDQRRLVVHVVYRFDVGGLENGVVNLINHMPATAWRHVVVAMTEVTDFKQRITRDDVEFIALHKPPGHGIWLYPRLYRLFRQLRPTIVHTRNLAALEAVVPAWVAGVPVRVHSEHGRDVDDIDGSSRRHQWMRRLYRPFVSHYIALSKDLARYLSDKVGVPTARLAQIYNGVDSARFDVAKDGRAPIAGSPFNDPSLWLIGTVGRMQTVKDQPMLARAFVLALQANPELRDRLRLVIVGDGPLRSEVQALLDQAGVADLCWLPGERRDVADVMRGLSCFALPSQAEGISNTILEAMASGLPVLATDVGGNAELVSAGRTGELVEAGQAVQMAQALVRLAQDPKVARAMGQAGRIEVLRRFSLQAMVAAYLALYDQLAAAAVNDAAANGAAVN